MATQANTQHTPVLYTAGVIAILTAIAVVVIVTQTTLDYWATIWHRVPYLLTDNQQWWPIEGGFAANVGISIACMIIGTVLGTFVGLGQVSRWRAVSAPMWLITQFFRNSPWLVVLYAILYLFPYRLELFGFSFVFPSVAKAIIGLSLPAAANVSEIVRGGVQSIPSTQWEAAASLGYTRRQAMYRIILPQALRRMIPPWMNLYAIITMGTALTNLVGVDEGLTAVRRVLELLGENYAIPLYGILMLLFLIYCYPIALASRKLEARFRQ
ncbi:amino acid ABC transporter permease [Salinisphaera sp. RV14]|uniref:amino acid ABC transporter permease n=1 Tax=unclassified Salinisphaera TaxID=2649847 RepID=UPI003F827AF4